MYNILLVVVLVLFVLSGVSVPLLIELIAINGGCERSTMLIALPGSLGMIFCIFINCHSYNQGKVRWKVAIFVALMELFSQLLNLNGLVMAGSAIYTVVYSSITIYTAIFSYIFLKKRLAINQWLGVIVVVIGLALTAVGSEGYGENVMIGIAMITIGTMTHSSTYIASEYLLLHVSHPISPELLATVLGICGTTLNLIWQISYTIPNYQDKVVREVERHDGNVSIILIGYALIVMVSAIHAICFFRLLGSIGSTSTGIMKGVQTTTVFIFSHYAYCHVQRSQCFTYIKAASLVTVITGVLLYSWSQEEGSATRATAKLFNPSQDNGTLDNDDKLEYELVNTMDNLSTHNSSENIIRSYHKPDDDDSQKKGSGENLLKQNRYVSAEVHETIGTAALTAAVACSNASIGLLK